MTAILEMSQYVAYQKNVDYAFKLNSVQSLTVFTCCAQWMGLAALLVEKHHSRKFPFLSTVVNSQAPTLLLQGDVCMA